MLSDASGSRRLRPPDFPPAFFARVRPGFLVLPVVGGTSPPTTVRSGAVVPPSAAAVVDGYSSAFDEEAPEEWRGPSIRASAACRSRSTSMASRP